MSCQTEQNQFQKISRMFPGNIKLHIASQIGGKSVIGNAEINVIVHIHRRWQQY